MHTKRVLHGKIYLKTVVAYALRVIEVPRQILSKYLQKIGYISIQTFGCPNVEADLFRRGHRAVAANQRPPHSMGNTVAVGVDTAFGVTILQRKV